MSFDRPQQNKMMEGPPAKKEYHFSGDGIWHNLTIAAENMEEATKKWLVQRRSIDDAPPAAIPTSTDIAPPEEGAK